MKTDIKALKYIFWGVLAIVFVIIQLLPDKKGSQTTVQEPIHLDETAAEGKGPWPFLNDESQGEVSADLMARNFVLIYDGSGSMNEEECAEGEKKISVARRAVQQWAETVPSDANLGLVSFHGPWTELPLRSGDRTAFNNAIQQIRPNDKTPLTAAFTKAYNMLTEQARSQLGYGEYTIVVVTDGIANDTRALSRKVNDIFNESPININTIGFCISGTHSLNQEGRTFYRSADNPDELRQGLKDALAEAETFDVADFN